MLSAKQRVKYNPDAMKRAIELVHSGVAKKKAATMCGVPRTTLLDKLYGRVPMETTKPGPKTVLTAAEENVLVEYINLMAEVGYPVGRQELCTEVKKVMDKDNRNTPFKNNLPGKDWFAAFLKRHPEVSERKPQALGRQRAGVNSEMVEGWFSGVKTYLEKEIVGWEEILGDPRRIFNADESGFPLCLTSKRVLANTGVKNIYQVVNGSKVQITVMACLNANGNFMPPMIVYPGQRFRNVGIDQFPSALYGHSEKGWMDADLFVDFLKHFKDFVKENSIAFPVLLFVDGHSTHMSLDTAEFCHENDIILYCLLPNATHLMQPCDIGLFGPLKTAWRNQVKAWQMQNVGESITKSVFPGVFKCAWERVTTIQIASHGFKRSGLFPFSSREIDYTKLGPAKLNAVAANDVKSCSSKPCSTVSSATDIASSGTSAEECSQSKSCSSKPCATVSSATDIASSGTSAEECSQSKSCSSKPCATVSSATDIASSGTSATECNQSKSCSSKPCATVSSAIDIASSGTSAEECSQSKRCSSKPCATVSSAIDIASSGSSSDECRQSSCQNDVQCPSETKSHISAITSKPMLSIPLSKPNDIAYVSPSFIELSVPQPKTKSGGPCVVRPKLTKAISGHQALKMLRDKEEKRKEDEAGKIERKRLRDLKKKERETEREKKLQEREEKKREREIMKAVACQKKSRKRKHEDSESDVSDAVELDDSESGEEEFGVSCARCAVESNGEGLVCCLCDRFWHFACTGMDVSGNHDFYCELCCVE